MPGCVLVVEDSTTNRLLIRARLKAAYYQVIEAECGERALELAAAERPDLVLLDVVMPGLDGLEVCRRLRADPITAQIPIVVLTALDGRGDRVRGLEAGADDFLTKPFDETALLSRVASLTRMKMMMDELTLRDETAGGLGTGPVMPVERPLAFPDSRVLIVGIAEESTAILARALSEAVRCQVEHASPQEAEALIGSTQFDAVLVDRGLGGADPLRLGASLRARPETRHTATLLVVGADEGALAARALELGFNDHIASPVDPVELVARVRLLLRRKHYADRLRERMRTSMVEALTDPLTGLHNRRYATGHLEALVRRCREKGSELTVMMLDLDRFKSVNDRHGHAVGDVVLREFARRLQASVRGADLVARMGGEEFMLAMPDTGPAIAAELAERIRTATADPPFVIPQSGEHLPVTVSIGYAVLAADESETDLIGRADAALYASKHSGRNRATLHDAA